MGAGGCGCSDVSSSSGVPDGPGVNAQSNGASIGSAPARGDNGSSAAFPTPDRVHYFLDDGSAHRGCGDPLCELCLRSVGGAVGKSAAARRAKARGPAWPLVRKKGRTGAHARRDPMDPRTWEDGRPPRDIDFPDPPRDTDTSEPDLLDQYPCDVPSGFTAKIKYFGSTSRYPFVITQPTTVVGDFDDVIDQQVMSFMLQNGMPQGTVSILSGDGRLVYARGFSNFNFFRVNEIENEFVCTLPDQAFRIASLTKPITATAIFMLIKAGDVSLTESFVNYLDTSATRHPSGHSLKPLPRLVPVPAGLTSTITSVFPLGGVTVQDLLRHTSGWCEQGKDCPSSSVGGSSWNGADDLTVKTAFPELSYPLSFETKVYQAFQADGFPNNNRQPILVWPESLAGSASAWHYSNLGYGLLGRIIEDVTGESYGRWVYNNIIQPCGMTCTYLGSTAESDIGPWEPRYYNNPDPGDTEASVLDNSREPLSLPYGGSFNLSNRRAYGGWVSTAVDYARFLNELRWNNSGRLLGIAQLISMHSSTSLSNTNYAHGWAYSSNYSPFQRSGSPAVFWNGTLSGTEAEFVMFTNYGAGLQQWQNAAVTCLFNRNLPNANPALLTQIIAPLLPGIADWGSFDLFSVMS